MLVDCSHQYSFNLSWADRTQDEIFPGIQCLTSGRTIHKMGLAPINVIVILGRGLLPYLPEDADHILNYVEQGGGLYISVTLGGEYDESLNLFLKKFGIAASPSPDNNPGKQKPFMPLDHPAALPECNISENLNQVSLEYNRSDWEHIYETDSAVPAVICRDCGKGQIIIDTQGIYDKSIRQKEPFVKAMRQMIEYLATTKQVDKIASGGGWQFSDGYRWDLVHTTDNGLRIHHNEYTLKQVEQDIKAYHATVDYLKEITGLDENDKATQIKIKNENRPDPDQPDKNSVDYVPEGILFQIKYLACIGAGFLLPQGSAVDLPPTLKNDWQVHLGMLSHEMGHAWSFPFCEVMGEESSAFIFNNLVLNHHYGRNHEDSVTKRLMRYLEKNDFDDADLAKNRSDFKYYMFIDLMIRVYGEGIWKNYNLLKFALLNQKESEWTPHTTAWLWSIAAGQDVFSWFNTAFSSSVDKTMAKLPQQAMNLEFDPIAVGKQFNVPLQKLTLKRDIFTTLNSFADVRKFYDRELADKGYPDSEG